MLRMAEKKIGDLAYAIIYLLLGFGVFFVLFNSFDSQYVNSDNIGSELQGIHDNESVSGGYYDYETRVQDITMNTSTFSVTAGSDVDVRGTSQSIISARDSPGIMLRVVNLTKNYFRVNNAVFLFVSSMIIITGLVLLFRFIRPGGA